MVDEINEVQQLQFELMKKASFNFFNGEKVVKDLIVNKNLWKGVVMGRAQYAFDDSDLYKELIDLICLRDIANGLWNVDTVYILVEEGCEDELEKLANIWDADEIWWMKDKVAQQCLGIGTSKDYSKKILRIWWD